eukprot:sb/3465901/
MRVGLVLFTLIGAIVADVYLHNPRGSNNRLNENTAVRNNANRLFDSQNNNRGGYNTGDATSGRANSNTANQYSMQYYQSGEEAAAQSKLIVEWTNQHGCGGSEDSSPHKLNCDVVIQYMCQDDVTQTQIANGANTNKDVYLRDGVQRNTQSFIDPNRVGIVVIGGDIVPQSHYTSLIIATGHPGDLVPTLIRSSDSIALSLRVLTSQDLKIGVECNPRTIVTIFTIILTRVLQGCCHGNQCNVCNHGYSSWSMVATCNVCMMSSYLINGSRVSSCSGSIHNTSSLSVLVERVGLDVLTPGGVGSQEGQVDPGCLLVGRIIRPGSTRVFSCCHGDTITWAHHAILCTWPTQSPLQLPCQGRKNNEL